MKVKIKKQGKKETYSTINSWSDVNLETWLQLIDLESGSKSKEAEETIAALSDIPRLLIKELALKDVALIMNQLAELQGEQDTVLKKIIEIDGIEYAMHPNLDDLTLGEYADIESFIKDGFEKNLAMIMAILFRPIVKKGENKNVYVIEGYDGDLTLRAEIMKKMSAEQVQSCLFFFWNFARELLMILPLFLMEQAHKMKEKLQTETLVSVGDGSE
tara:strand:+ start:31 stop:678 length:648 start_codon:yes stop_codon:yes gene_type:complete